MLQPSKTVPEPASIACTTLPDACAIKTGNYLPRALFHVILENFVQYALTKQIKWQFTDIRRVKMVRWAVIIGVGRRATVAMFPVVASMHTVAFPPVMQWDAASALPLRECATILWTFVNPGGVSDATPVHVAAGRVKDTMAVTATATRSHRIRAAARGSAPGLLRRYEHAVLKASRTCFKNRV